MRLPAGWRGMLGGSGLLPLAAAWLAALLLCLSSWQLLRGDDARQLAERAQRAEAVAAEELAFGLRNPADPELPARTRALLLRGDIGFAYLRLRDLRGQPLAAAGRYDGLAEGLLPRPWAQALRLQLYRAFSEPRQGELFAHGRRIGSLEYGLLAAGAGSGGWRTGLAGLGLLAGLPLLGWLSLRLGGRLAQDFRLGAPALARRLQAQSPAAAPAEQQQTSGQLLAVFDRGLVMLDRQMRVTYMNEMAERITGWRAAEAQSALLPDVLPLFGEDLQRPVALPLLRCLNGEVERVQQRLQLRRRGGSLLGVEITAAPQRDSQGRITGALLSLRELGPDEPLPVAAAQELAPAGATGGLARMRDSSELSMMLLDQVLECVVTTDSQDRIQFANTRALQAFGYSLGELRGAHISRLLPQPFLQRLRLSVADFMLLTASGQERPELVAQRRDGTRFAASLTVHPVAFRGRQGFVLTIRKAVATPAASGLSPRLRQLLEAADGEAYIFDAASLRLVEANATARGRLGYDGEQLAQLTLLQLCPRLNPEILESHIARLRLGAESQVRYRTLHQRADGDLYDVEVRLHFLGEETPPVLLATAVDLSRPQLPAARALDEDRLDFLAYHDALTGLPSRLLLMDRLHKAQALAGSGGRGLALLCIGLAGFRQVNERFGYEAGDELLKAAADRLSAVAGAGDTVARLAGDEFALLLAGVDDEAALRERVQGLQAAFARPLHAAGQALTLGLQVGVSLYPSDPAAAEALLAHAATAMRAAKQRPGRGGFQRYQPTPAAAPVAAATPAPPADAEAELQRLLAADALAVDYQPLLDTQLQQLLAVEVLLSWRDAPQGVLRSAAEIRARSPVPGLAERLALWVLERACAQQAAWRSMDLPAPPLVLDLSQLPLAADTAARLRELLARQRIAAEQLILLLDEGQLAASGWLQPLRAEGLRLGAAGIDPAHTELLRRADLDLIRLPAAVTAGLPGNARAAAQAAAVIETGRRLGARVVAAGVARTEQMDALATLGCHLLQGPLQGGVMGERDFVRYLARSEIGALV